MDSQYVDLQELSRRSKNISWTVIFVAAAIGALIISLTFLVLNRSGEDLSRTVNERGAIIEGVVDNEARANARAADQARWEALGDYFVTLAGLRPDRAVMADQARWEAVGLYYNGLAAAARERGATADKARWEALGEHYVLLAGLRSEDAAAADQARWEAMGEHFAILTGFQPEGAVAADQARWEAKGESYQATSPLSGVEHTNLAMSAQYTGVALQQYQLTGDPVFLPRCVSPELKAILAGASPAQILAEVATCSD